MDLLTVNDQPREYPRSYYAATASSLAPMPPPQGNLSCDVCVVGGGYTGLSTALHLAERGYDVVLVEANRVGWGASGRNGGQVGTGQRVEQDELERMVGLSDAKALWALGLESVALVKDLIANHNIACGWSDGIIHADHRARFVPHSHAYADHLAAAYGYDQIEKLDRDQMHWHVGSPAYHGGTLDHGSGHLHPLNYALGLARAAKAAGVRIYEGARVDAIGRGAKPWVTVARSQIKADYVALCCNGYIGGLAPDVLARVLPINNFIAATHPLSEDEARALIRNNHAVADSKFVINYFRLSEDRRLLFGGGESYGTRFPSDIEGLVCKNMASIFPHLQGIEIDYVWGGTLGITLNRMPSFQRLSGNVLSVGGYSGHGVALASLSGKLMAEAIAGQAERFDIMARIAPRPFPGGRLMRLPLMVLGMLWYSLRDRF